MNNQETAQNSEMTFNPSHIQKMTAADCVKLTISWPGETQLSYPPSNSFVALYMYKSYRNLSLKSPGIGTRQQAKCRK
jgi:hypothetical protein